MKDGRLNKCIECTKQDVIVHRKQNLERIRAYDKFRSSMPHRVAARKEYVRTPKGKAVKAKAQKASYERYPDRTVARWALSNAIRDKKILRMPCQVCGDLKSEGHHTHYDNPLGVVWLCKKHHCEVHALAKELKK
jgi:hypothetical protein